MIEFTTILINYGNLRKNQQMMTDHIHHQVLEKKRTYVSHTFVTNYYAHIERSIF